MWVSHYFSHFGSSLAERETFRDALREAGFGAPDPPGEVGVTEEVSGDGYWHHWAFTILAASSEELTAADDRACRIAAANGVRYDSWEVQRRPDRVGPPKSTGPSR